MTTSKAISFRCLSPVCGCPAALACGPQRKTRSNCNTSERPHEKSVVWGQINLKSNWMFTLVNVITCSAVSGTMFLFTYRLGIYSTSSMFFFYINKKKNLILKTSAPIKVLLASLWLKWTVQLVFFVVPNFSQLNLLWNVSARFTVKVCYSQNKPECNFSAVRTITRSYHHSFASGPRPLEVLGLASFGSTQL